MQIGPWLFAGGVDVTTSDGEKRRFQDGDVLLVEDTTGAVSSRVTVLYADQQTRCCVAAMSWRQRT